MGVTRPYAAIPLQLHLPRELPSTAIGGACGKIRTPAGSGWDGAPHQTTIESTESKRCGLLRTGANRIEKPAGTAIGHGRSSRFFALIGRRYAASTSFAFWGQFNSGSGIEPESGGPAQSTPIYTHSSRVYLEAMQLH